MSKVKPANGNAPVQSPPRVAPVVVTLVLDPESGNLAITPVYKISADGLILVLQNALRQVTAFAAVQSAQRQNAERAPQGEPKGEG